MIRTSQSRRTASGTAAAAALEIIAGLTGFWLRRVEVSLVAATASVYGFGRPAAKGITPTAPVAFPLEGVGPTTVSASTAVAWGTGPTVPTSFYRQNSMTGAIGQTLVWVFDGVWIPIGASIVLWNTGTNSIADVNITIDEA